MLVLSRKEGQCVVIGGKVVVTVLEVRGHRVRLGLEAPLGIEILREEIYRRKDGAVAQDGNAAAPHESLFLPEFA